MLEHSLFESQGRMKTRKPVTVLVSTIVHLALVFALALIPLLQTHAVPQMPLNEALVPPRRQPPKAIEVIAAKPYVQPKIVPDAGAVIAPTAIPEDIAYVVDAPASNPFIFAPSPAGDTAAAILRELVNRQPEPARPDLPLPPLPPMPVKAAPVRVGGNAQLARLVQRVQPVYPPLARQARIQGTVTLEAVVTTEGTIAKLNVISGHPLLTQAALDAVSQWVYRPTLLNGEPIEVVTTITVTFSFQ